MKQNWVSTNHEIGRNLLCRTLILTPNLDITNCLFLQRKFTAPETDVNIQNNAIVHRIEMYAK